MRIAKHHQRRRCNALLAGFIGAAFATLAAVPPTANAACMVTTGGAVDCNANTATTDAANLDGARSLSSDRTQRFDMSGRIWTPPDCNRVCKLWSKGHNC